MTSTPAQKASLRLPQREPRLKNACESHLTVNWRVLDMFRLTGRGKKTENTLCRPEDGWQWLCRPDLTGRSLRWASCSSHAVAVLNR